MKRFAFLLLLAPALFAQYVEDARGNLYRIDRRGTSIIRESPDGEVTTVAKHFRDARWLTIAPSGTLYLVDHLDVVRVRDGEVERIARNVARSSLWRPDIPRRDALVGLWVDEEENVYILDAAHGEVKRIGADGKMKTVARSRRPWTPTGGAFARNGDLLIFEESERGRRVRRVPLP